MADTSKIVPVLLIGGGAYLAYQLFFATPAAAAPASPSGTAGAAPTMPNLTGSPAPAAAPQPVQAPQSAYNSLDATFQRLSAQVQANASDPAITQQQGQAFAKPSVLNYYLGQISSYALDANGMAAAFPGGDVPMSLPSFWSAASQYLAQNKGLSGLGFYGSVFQRRRW